VEQVLLHFFHKKNSGREKKMNDQYEIVLKPTQEEIKLIHQKVENYKMEQTQGEYGKPGIEINLILKDEDEQVVGGVIASTVFRVMHLDVLWVADEYRRCGYGRDLVLTAERIGYENGCRASQTWTFAFQAPGFYPAIGYRQIGTYDGYPGGLTEHAFMKRLSPQQKENTIFLKFGERDSNGIYLNVEATDEDLGLLHKGLMDHVSKYVSGDTSATSINLGLKDASGNLIGGLHSWTTLNNLIFEYVWIDEEHRRKGFGTRLMQEVERIAKEKNCIASQAYCFSFQAPEFFQNNGYLMLGVSHGYPEPFKEYYFIKKYQ
jgi:GNAT superfamily N-acetyltransferase